MLVIGATNRPDSIDPGLRRAGRFDREISLGIPDENARMRSVTICTISELTTLYKFSLFVEVCILTVVSHNAFILYCRILQVLCRDLRLAPDLSFGYLARMTPGYVGADLMSLAREAAITAVNR